MRYNKLVRDHIPEIIEQNGKTAVFRMIEDKDEYNRYLEKKLDEEVEEFHNSKSIDEIADILEVITAIMKARGIDPHYVDMRRRMKSAKRGKFDKRILLIKVKNKPRGRT